MIEKVRAKSNFFIRHIFNNDVVREFVRGFLPRDRYLEFKLREICSKCPLHSDAGYHRNVSPSDREALDMCRMRYFGCLLQSFVGKPGDEETRKLYSYLKRCDDCLFSGMDNDSILTRGNIEAVKLTRERGRASRS